MTLSAKGPLTDYSPLGGGHRSYGAWIERFEKRAARYKSERLAFDERPLSASEAKIVGASIAQFQLGEVSDGAYLIKTMSDYAVRRGEDELFTLAHKLLQESHHHASLLSRFMEHHGLKKKRLHPLDAAFRVVRRLGGVETMLSTLLVAELVATHYYQCLGHSTRSIMLKRISAELLEDEFAHIQLFTQLLSELREGRPEWIDRITTFIEKAVLTSALIAVWPFHHKVYRRAGTNFSAYWAIYWRRYREAYGVEPVAG